MTKLLTNERIVWIDYIKFFLIFLMVLGHTNTNPIITTVIYVFHIPAFFFISGFLSNTKKDIKIKSYIPLIYAIVIYNFLSIFVHILNHTLPLSHIFRSLGGIFFTEDNSYFLPQASQFWFVFVLIFMKYIYAKWLSNHDHIWTIIFMIFCVLYILASIKFSFSTFFYLDRIFMCFPFFILGRLFAADKKLLSYILKRDPKSYIVYLICLAVVSYISYLNILNNKRTDIFFYDVGYNTITFYIGAIAGIILMIQTSYVISTVFNEKKFVKITSIGTLLILGLHRPFCFYFGNSLLVIIEKMTGFRYSFDLGLYQAIFTIIFCYPLIIIGLKYGKVLLGK